MALIPKLILPLIIIVEGLVWVSIFPDNIQHISIVEFINFGMLCPAILGAILLWLYQYDFKPLLNTLAHAFLMLSCSFYAVYALFIVFIMLIPGSVTTEGTNTGLFFSVILMMIPLLLNIYLLYKRKEAK